MVAVVASTAAAITMDEASTDEDIMAFQACTDWWTDTVTTMDMTTGTGSDLVTMNALCSANV